MSESIGTAAAPTVSSEAGGQPAAGAGQSSAAGAHSFDLSKFEVFNEERPNFEALADAVHAKGGTQADLDALYGRYKSLAPVATRDVELRGEVDAMDRKHEKEARETMRAEWGASLADNFALIRKYLEGLPANERREIEFKVLPDGRHSLHDPATLRALAERARSDLLPSDGKARESEIAEIEKEMRLNRSEYFKDPAKQARYRELLRARG